VFGQMGWSKADIDAADLWELTDILETGTPCVEREGELPPIDASTLNFEEIARNIEENKHLLDGMKGAAHG
jgi:hypothetical protein